MKKKSRKKKERSPTLPKENDKDIENGLKEENDTSRNTSRGRRSLSSLFRRSADSKERALSESPDRTKSTKSEDDENKEEDNNQQNDSPDLNPRINPRKHLGRMTVREALVETKSRGRSPGKHIVKLQKSVLENKPRDSLSNSIPHILDQFPDPKEVKHKDHDPQSGAYTLPRSKRRSRAERQAQGSSVDKSELEVDITHNQNKILPLDKRKYMIKKDNSLTDIKDYTSNEKYSPSRSPYANTSRDVSPYNYTSINEQDGQRRDTFAQFMQLRETRPSSRSSTLSNDKLSAFTPIHEPRKSPQSSVIPETHSPSASEHAFHKSISPSNASRQFRSFPQERNSVFQQPTRHHISNNADDIPKSDDIDQNKSIKETKNSRGTFISPRRFSRNSRSSDTSDTLTAPVDNEMHKDDCGEEERKFKYHRQFSNSSEKARQKKIKKLQERKNRAEKDSYKPIDFYCDRPDKVIYKTNSKENLTNASNSRETAVQVDTGKEMIGFAVKADTHEIETQTSIDDTEPISKPTLLTVKTVQSSSDVPNISQENLFVPITSNADKRDNEIKISNDNTDNKTDGNVNEAVEPMPVSDLIDQFHGDRDHDRKENNEDFLSENLDNEVKSEQNSIDDRTGAKDKKKSKFLKKKTDKKSDKKAEKKSDKKSDKKKKKSKSVVKKEDQKIQENNEVESIQKDVSNASENVSNELPKKNSETCIDNTNNDENKQQNETNENDNKIKDDNDKRSLKKKKKEKRASSLKSIRKKHKDSDADGLTKVCRSSSLTSIPMPEVKEIKRQQSSVKEKKSKPIKRSKSVENVSKKGNTKQLTRSKTVKKPPSSVIKDDKKEQPKPLEVAEAAKPDKPTPKLSLGAIITMRAKISRMKKAREEREAAAAKKREEGENTSPEKTGNSDENDEDKNKSDDKENDKIDNEQDRDRVFYENELNASLGSQGKTQDNVNLDEDILSLDKEVKDIVYEKRIHFSSYCDDTISEEEMIKQRQRNTRLTGRRESKVRLRQKKFIACCKQAIAFLFSHIGLCSLVIGYCIAGGFIFRSLEGEQELKQRTKMENLRKNYTDKIYSLAFDTTMNKGNREDFRKEVSEILKSYSQIIFKHTKEAGWDGNDNYGNGTTAEVEQWSFPSSLLYAITVMTTIGYGHVAPKTPHGRIVTIAYAVLGIPLTLLCLTNIGDVMAHGFRLLYGKVFCGVCCVLFRPPRRKRIDPEKGIPADDKILVHDDEKSEEVIQVPTSVCLLLMSAYIMLGTLAFCRWEGWDVVTGTYFCFITLSTIGFGDVVPGMSSKNWNKNEKLVLCGLYLLFGLSLIAMCFNLVQEDVKAKCKRIGKKLGIIDK